MNFFTKLGVDGKLPKNMIVLTMHDGCVLMGNIHELLDGQVHVIIYTLEFNLE